MRSSYAKSGTYGMHPQDFYAVCSPATSTEEALWIINLYYLVPGQKG